MVKIKEMPLSERPVERLINSGSKALSNDELLGIILKTGTKEISSKELGLQILKEKPINELSNITYEELIKIKGIGIKKATIILAVIELAKRMHQNISNLKGIKMNHPQLLFEYYRNIFWDTKQENFYAIYLDNKGVIIKDKLLFLGTINYSMVSPREIFKEAYLCDAASIILLHNHPSNNVVPSHNDLETTINMIQVGKLLGIKVLDHIIVGKNKYYSLKENEDI